ncbi:hypothetical protein ACJX0J_042199, partial [Zea mays]
VCHQYKINLGFSKHFLGVITAILYYYGVMATLLYFQTSTGQCLITLSSLWHYSYGMFGYIHVSVYLKEVYPSKGQEKMKYNQSIIGNIQYMYALCYFIFIKVGILDKLNSKPASSIANLFHKHFLSRFLISHFNSSLNHK